MLSRLDRHTGNDVRLLEKYDRPFFGSNTLTYAECVAGTVVPLLSWVGVSVDGYPKIQAWCDRLLTRPSWQKTQFTQADLAAFFSRRQKFLEQSQAS